MDQDLFLVGIKILSIVLVYSCSYLSGEEFVDTVTLGSLTLAQQSIGVADTVRLT